VVSRAAFASRPVLPASELPPPAVESAITIGPYHVLQTLTESAGEKWFLAYDLRLLRKVWLRMAPAGALPVPVELRNLGRIGRLRWLTGKRSPKEDWDAFEALDGRPFLEASTVLRPWSEVRYWLYDVATEISAAEKDGTLPELALDRVWITGDDRAKLLDFPAPGLGGKSETRNPNPGPKTPTTQGFLAEVVAAALEGTRAASVKAVGEVAVPLPLHARAFLRSLSQMVDAEAIAAALKPLLSRVAAVTRLRRAALVAGCMLFPLVSSVGGLFGLTFLQEVNRRNPGLMDLNTVLQIRATGRIWESKKAQFPSDREFAVYIAHHFRGVITNAATWSSWMVASMVKGEARKFAEQSVVEYPAPSEAEISAAEAAVGKYVPKHRLFGETPSAALPGVVLAAVMLIYVGFPALVAAVLFRGGLVLLIAGVTYARRDGARASRLRLLWRAMLAWWPVLLVFNMAVLALATNWLWAPWLALALFGLLAAVSVALPERGLQDRLAGTWPVPR
jgi:hypothetical protein